MTKKLIITNTEIEKDIATALKNPPDMSESTFKKWTLPIVLISITLVVLEFVYPLAILWAILGMVVLLFAAKIFKSCRLNYLIKNISMDDYEIITDTVSHIYSENYKINGATATPYQKGERVENYIIYFEGRKSWKIPKENYLWSVERPMSDFSIYNSTHREDAYIIVVKKKDGKIVVAYHTDFFEYKN